MSFINYTIQLINQINEKYEHAYADLLKIIGELENSLKTIIPGLEFKLKELSDGPGGTIFSLDLDPNSKDYGIDIVKITDFFISSQGYPIEQGKFIKLGDQFDTIEKLNNKYELEEFFKKLLSSSDSRLVQSIGYAARRQKLNRLEEPPF